MLSMKPPMSPQNARIATARTRQNLHKRTVNIAMRVVARDWWLVYQGYNRCECGAYLRNASRTIQVVAIITARVGIAGVIRGWMQ
jgi:hypothetical protein